MVANVNMLGPAMVNRVLDNGLAPCELIKNLIKSILKLSCYHRRMIHFPCFMHSIRAIYSAFVKEREIVHCFHIFQGNTTPCVDEVIASGRWVIISVSSLVWITIPNESFTVIPTINWHVMLGSFEVTKNIEGSIQVQLSWIWSIVHQSIDYKTDAGA